MQDIQQMEKPRQAKAGSTDLKKQKQRDKSSERDEKEIN